MEHFICPVCGEPLILRENTYICTLSHSFDRAKSGYVNLLRSQVSGKKDTINRCWREFLTNVTS